MKLQTSLEFMLVLSAIGSLLLVVVLYYGSSIKAYSINQSFTPNSISFQQYPSSNDSYGYLLAYANQTSSVEKKNAIQILLYGCTEGSANMTLNSTGSSLLSTRFTKVKFYNTGLILDYFVPYSAGLVELNISYSIYCGSNSHAGDFDISSFAESGASSNSTPPLPNQLSAYISQRNESMIYTNFSTESVYTLSEANHCTYTDFFGNPLPPAWQCGTTDSWDYNIFSPTCYEYGAGQTETYCIYPDQTQYTIKSPNIGIGSYLYNFSLGIYNGTSAYLSRINSSVPSSPVFYSNMDVGNAIVSSAYAQPYNPTFNLLSSPNSSIIINSSIENQYENAKTSAFSTFSFYNTSGVSGSTVGIIQQQVTEFNNIAEQLINSKSAKIQGCIVTDKYLRCESPYPFQYSINVSLSSRELTNQTIYAEGSKISISNK